MKTLLVAREDLSALYGSTAFILTDKRCAPRLASLLAGNMDVFSVSDTGVIHRLDNPGPGSGAVPLQGCPAGFAAAVFAKKSKDIAEAVTAFLEEKAPHSPPVMKVFDARPSLRALADFAVGLLAEVNGGLQTQLAKLEREMVSLRQDKEDLCQGMERSRRLMNALGQEARVTSALVPPGNRTVGPNGDVALSFLQQILPVDAVGICGLSLYCEMPGGADVTDGTLTLRLISCQANAVISRQVVPFSSLKQGWMDVPVTPVDSRYLGDALLEVEWCASGDGPVPSLRLGALPANRFGVSSGAEGTEAEGSTLALKVKKGLADPFITPAGHYGTHQVFEEKLSGLRRFATVVSTAESTTSLVNQAGFDPVSYSDDWLQTHPVRGEVVGVRFSEILPKNLRSVSVDMGTAHDEGPQVTYILALIPKGAVFDCNGLKGLLTSGGLVAGQTVETDRGWLVSATSPNPGQTATLQLEVSCPHDGYDLVVAVSSETGSVSFGWCRWYGLRWKTARPDSQQQFSAPDMAFLRGADRDQTAVSPLRFPELSSQIEFIGGRMALNHHIERLGFNPMIVSDELGYLQTHPIKGSLSAALLPCIIPTGTKRISAPVRIAHAAAPASFFVLIALEASDVPAERRVTEILDRVRQSSVAEGQEQTEGAAWAFKSVSALANETVELVFVNPVEKVGDLVLAVLNTDDDASFGWCRWYGINMVMQMQASAGTEAG